MTTTVSILFTIIILGTIPFTFADSERNNKLEFAGTLEETLGHFWALGVNLDENNSKLALVHATHPISELYGTMSEYLGDNPDFTQKLEQTLFELKDKASTDVTREEAQLAIDDAENGDFSLCIELFNLLKNPYSEQIEFQTKWFAKRPEWARNKVGCSMLSCSS